MQRESSFESSYAHTLPNKLPVDWEPLSDHLEKVAETALQFADAFGAKPWGEVLGRCHDLGKRSEDFQRYLQDAGRDAVDAGVEDEGKPGRRVDHSTFGARYVAEAAGKMQGQLLAFCIAGHHTGLPDESSSEDGSQRTTLRHKLDATKYPIPAVDVPMLVLPELKCPIRPQAGWGFSLAFFTRMLFSCLVDADRTRTEEFCDPSASEERSQCRSARPSLAVLKEQLDASLAKKAVQATSTEVNRQRQVVLEHCRNAAALKPGFFSLDVPTGGGKTLSSLAFSLDHALQHQLRRVVMAIPFTSIIEQTADVYRRELDPLGEAALVEHHTNLQPSKDTRANQLGTENWDAPIVVTTNVQLLESLFAYRTTPCRKLHNLASSVIVLDEAQTIPVELLKPALAALRELVLNYRCSIVLCTATQPALERRDDFKIGIEDIRPIIPDTAQLFAALRRVEVRRLGRVGDGDLAERLASERAALCIVNTRKHAADLYDQLAERTAAEECFHLSTWMCGAHRRAVLKIVRARLDQRLSCRLISTQLVEAGVDVDFPTVYRAETGFDSIAQAAGRCNREGLLPLGITYVFEGEQRPPDVLRSAADTAKELFPAHPDPLAPQAIEAYFKHFYWSQSSRWDKHKVMETMDVQNQHLYLQFRQAADRFRIIRDEELPILVHHDAESAILLNNLSSGKVPFVSQRELQPYLVSVRKQGLAQMQSRGFITEHESGVWLLLNHSMYSKTKGLDPKGTALDASLWGV